MVVCAFLTLFWGLGSLQLMSLNEGRRALVVKEMFQTKDWLLPRLNGELYLTKPPLFYWFSMSISEVFGTLNEWTLRLPSAIAAAAVLGIVYRFTRQRYGVVASVCAMALLVANLGFAMLARRAEIEMLLTLLCFGSLISAILYMEQQHKRIWLYLSYSLLGLAVLTKGPVAMLFVTLPLLILSVWTRDEALKRFMQDWKAWVLFFLVALSWYAIVTLKLGPDIWSQIVKRDMVEKMQGDNNVKPLLSYLGWIVVDFLFLVGLFLVKPDKSFKGIQKQRNLLILAAATIVPILVFSLFSNKHAKYLLPVYPVIAILLGIHLSRLYEAASLSMKKLMNALVILMPATIAIFYVAFEAHVFNYRISAFPEFQQWSQKVSADRLYAYKSIDSRLIFYSNKPVVLLDKQEWNAFRQKQQNFMLLAEDIDVADNFSAACRLEEFEPYLKRKKKLVVLGFGSMCHTGAN